MYDAFVVILAVSIGVAGHEMFGVSMLSRPTVVASLARALMRNLRAGLTVGALLETISMGAINIGISNTMESSLVTELTTAFAIKMGRDVNAIISIVPPLTVLGLQLINMVFSFVCGPMAAKFSRFAKSGDRKGIINLHFFMQSVHYALYALAPSFTVSSGADVVKSVLDNISGTIINGLVVAGSLLSAVGVAMPLRVFWSKDTAIWFLFGTTVMAYLELLLVAIAAIGTIIAVVIAQGDLQLRNISVHAVQSDATVNATLDQEEEDFFQ